MRMLYNSDSFVVVRFDVPTEQASDATPAIGRGGFEIVDKLAQREIFIEGPIADSFQQGVQALAEQDSSPEDFDEFIGRYCVLAQQPVILH